MFDVKTFFQSIETDIHTGDIVKDRFNKRASLIINYDLRKDSFLTRKG